MLCTLCCKRVEDVYWPIQNSVVAVQLDFKWTGPLNPCPSSLPLCLPITNACPSFSKLRSVNGPRRMSHSTVLWGPAPSSLPSWRSRRRGSSAPCGSFPSMERRELRGLERVGTHKVQFSVDSAVLSSISMLVERLAKP